MRDNPETKHLILIILKKRNLTLNSQLRFKKNILNKNLIVVFKYKFSVSKKKYK